MLDIRR